MESKPLEYDVHWIWFWGPDAKRDFLIYGSEKFYDFEVLKGYSDKHALARKSDHKAYWSNYMKITAPKE